MPVVKQYLRRSLGSHVQHGVTCLSCVAWPDPVGGMGFRAFFAAGTPPDLFQSSDKPGYARLSGVQKINQGVLLSGMTEAISDHVCLSLKDGALNLPVTAPETDLFDGMTCLVAERHGEPIEVVRDWVAHHVRHFGVDGVLLIDRTKEHENNGFVSDLQVYCGQSGLQCIVHLTAGIPLGAQTLPAASHPFNAPDAPGKDRMTELAPDPWHAPLGEGFLYELLKWRFLARARTVANLDLTDLLEPGSAAFSQVHSSSTGVISLLGTRIYPWRLRKGQSPQFGDHICRQFDTNRVNRRWCAAPARLKLDQVWRLVRITDATPQEDERAGFWRAMSIRHPQSAIADIVPKTSLVEDQALIDMAQNLWHHTPIRAPKSVPRPRQQSGRTLIVTCMKNEGPFILEWLAFHRAIGVDDFLIYTNDCTDGTDELLNALMARSLVQRRDNRFHRTGIKPQHWALAASERERLLQEAGWIISMDVDEFINIHVGEGRLSDLYAAIGDANMISLTWRLFGNADRHAFEDGFVTRQFDRCAPQLTRKPHQAWGFKTLFRNLGIYKKMGVHRPKGLKPDLWDHINWVNGAGEPMPAKIMRNGWRSSLDSYGYDLVTLNHYAVRSAESFLVKRDRGRVNHVERDQGLNYWFRMNNNAQVDRSIKSKSAPLQAEFDKLMSDPELRALHAACVAHHRAKIAELKARPDYAQFYATLTSPRMQRLSRMHAHFGANVFMEGPEVVPDDVVSNEDLPEDFFFTVARKAGA
ncbi:MAG: glycosyltransferase family 2 protein [Pseudomonadota bacterium]